MITFIANALLLSLGINLTMFAIAYKLQSDKLTDISYAVTFATIAVYAYLQSSQSLYHVLMLVLIIIWSVRLGGFLLYRVSKTGKDSRFDKMRSDFLAFGKFWVLQAITVWILMIPFVLASNNSAEGSALVLLGATIWGIGLLIESTADFQKFMFSSQANNKGKWIQQGIWKYSRHPNYFGEILIWVGVYLLAVQSLSLNYALVALISPIFISVLLIFVSGIPILEKSADKKWGQDSDYIKYKKQTSVLVPLPTKN